MKTKAQKPNVSVACVGPCPPPVNGASNIHVSFINELRSRNAKVILVNTSQNLPITASVLSTTLSRVLSRLYCLLVLISKLQHIDSIYLTLSGGPGQIFDLIIFLIAFIAKKRLACHHHSFSYIQRWSLPAAVMSIFVRDNVMHIFLGENMQKNYFEKYAQVKSLCISNLAFMPSLACNYNLRDTRIASGEFLVLGHLSNLSYQKGSHHFVELARICDERANSWKFLLAGPIVDSRFRRDYLQVIDQLRNISYLGPLDSNAKAKFYRSIDIFILLSEYINEAEPLVLLEAVSNGAVPVATQVGEIPSLIYMQNLLTKGEYLPREAFEIISSIVTTNKFHRISCELHEHFLCLQARSLSNKKVILEYLTTRNCKSK